MVTNDQIMTTIQDCANKGHIVNARDIAYAILCMHFEDSLVAFKAIFRNDNDYNEEYHNTYDNSDMMTYLKTYVDINLINKKKKRTKDDDISFEENKAYMLKLKKDTEDAMERHEIEKKDGLKILAQISTTLNDKFNVTSEEKNQIVIVNQKYDDLCPRCFTEIARRPISKEEAIEMYDLIEKK